MNNRSLLRLLTTAALLGALSGCASLSKSECLNANWEDIGVRDGANGQPEEYLIQHSTACAKVNVAPDRGACPATPAATRRRRRSAAPRCPRPS